MTTQYFKPNPEPDRKEKMIFRIILFGIIILLLIVGLSSCATKKRCMAKYPPQEFSFQSDSTFESDSVYTEEAEVFVEGEEVYVEHTIPCPEVKDVVKTKKEKHLTATLTIKGGTVECDCKEDSIRVAYEKEFRKRIKFSGKTKIVTRVNNIDRPYIPWWAKLLFWSVVGALFFALIRVNPISLIRKIIRL